tara:strand:+ start:144 stop:422 length:279 start_codon:yes stop_codon:yes gene_type:complete
MFDTITLPDGRLQHKTGNWIGIQNSDESMTKTKWRKTDMKYWEVQSDSKSKPGVVYTYTVTKNILGIMACDCLGYRYHKDCKHIKEINEQVL